MIVRAEPATPLDLQIRVNRNNQVTFRFFDEDGNDYDIDGDEWEFHVKRQPNGRNLIRKENGELTISGNEIVVELDEVDTDLNPNTYYYELYNVSEVSTYINGSVYAVDGKFTGTVTEATVTIYSENVVNVTVTIGGSGESGGSAADGTVVIASNFDLSGGTIPTTGGKGSGGAIEKGNLFPVTVGGTITGWASETAYIPAGAWMIAKVDTPGQTESNWLVKY